MKLYFWRFNFDGVQTSNFGDELNDYIFPQLIPELLHVSHPSNETLTAIGTIINEEFTNRVPEPRIVFGSGVGYVHKQLPNRSDLGLVYGLRGLLSCEALDIPEGYAIGDPAYLVSKIFQSSRIKKHAISYMPHIDLLLGNNDQVVRDACFESGVKFIDPRLPVDVILRLIDESCLVMAEAMHGAIVADVLRVPWIPIKTATSILEFKWLDWLSMMDLPYEPLYLERVYQPRKPDILRKTIYKLRRRYFITQFGEIVNRIIETDRGYLSSSAKHKEIVDLLSSRLEQLKADFFRI